MWLSLTSIPTLIMKEISEELITPLCLQMYSHICLRMYMPDIYLSVVFVNGNVYICTRMVNRIHKIIKEKKLTAARFAEIIDVQRSNVSHVLSGRNKPSLDFVLRILENFNELDPEWLLFGKGNMNRNETASKAAEIDLFNSVTDDSVSKETRSEGVKSDTDQKRSVINQTHEDLSSGQSQRKKIMKIMFFYEDRSFEVFDSEV